MYLKKMTALSDFSFLKTGNLSSPRDDEHPSAMADDGVAPAFWERAVGLQTFLTL